MLMFKTLKLNSAKSRLVEERLYEMVMDELESGNIRKGIWGKALAASNGNDNQAKSKYLELRVESLKDEAHVIQSILDSAPDVIEEKEPESELDLPQSNSNGGLLWLICFVVFGAVVFAVGFTNNIS